MKVKQKENKVVSPTKCVKYISSLQFWAIVALTCIKSGEEKKFNFGNTYCENNNT